MRLFCKNISSEFRKKHLEPVRKRTIFSASLFPTRNIQLQLACEIQVLRLHRVTDENPETMKFGG